MDSWLELQLSLAAVGVDGVQHKGVGRRPGNVGGLAIAIFQVDIREYPEARSPWPEGVEFQIACQGGGAGEGMERCTAKQTEWKSGLA